MKWKTKLTQVVDTLRSLLLAGEWQEALPGYRNLGQILEVSRPTIEKALAELTAEGLLAEAEIGKRRKILVAHHFKNPGSRLERRMKIPPPDQREFGRG